MSGHSRKKEAKAYAGLAATQVDGFWDELLRLGVVKTKSVEAENAGWHWLNSLNSGLSAALLEP